MIKKINGFFFKNTSQRIATRLQPIATQADVTKLSSESKRVHLLDIYLIVQSQWSQFQFRWSRREQKTFLHLSKDNTLTMSQKAPRSVRLSQKRTSSNSSDESSVPKYRTMSNRAGLTFPALKVHRQLSHDLLGKRISKSLFLIFAKFQNSKFQHLLIVFHSCWNLLFCCAWISGRRSLGT